MYDPAFITITTTCGPRLRLAKPPNVRLSAESQSPNVKTLSHSYAPRPTLYWQLSCMPGDAMFPKRSVFTCWISHF